MMMMMIKPYTKSCCTVSSVEFICYASTCNYWINFGRKPVTLYTQQRNKEYFIKNNNTEQEANSLEIQTQ